MIVLDWGQDEFDDAKTPTEHATANWGLVAPAPHHAPTVASWSESAAEADAWASMSHDPFPPRIVAGWWEVQYSSPWVLADEEGVAVGYGEIWDDADGFELARIIVDPEHRRKGVGRRLIAALLAEGRRRHGMVDSFLRVAPNNVAARELHRACGFVEVGEAEASAWNIRQPKDYVWMRHEASPLVMRGKRS